MRILEVFQDGSEDDPGFAFRLSVKLDSVSILHPEQMKMMLMLLQSDVRLQKALLFELPSVYEMSGYNDKSNFVSKFSIYILKLTNHVRLRGSAIDDRDLVCEYLNHVIKSCRLLESTNIVQTEESLKTVHVVIKTYFEESAVSWCHTEAA